MSRSATQNVNNKLKTVKRKKWYHYLFSAMASIVVFCTIYALILPAITAEKKLICGLEPHAHEESCYEQILICEDEIIEDEIIEAETEEHIHTDECYETKLICDLPEHIHELSCYDESNEDEELENGENLIAPMSELSADYITVTEATEVSEFYLWIFKSKQSTGNANKAAGFSQWDNPNGSGNFDNKGITDALTYTENGEKYYLIPIRYFEQASASLPDFSFDSENVGACPFVYAPNANNVNLNALTSAVYAKYNENWFVRIQDTSGANPNRCNIFYAPSNSFTLTYNNHTITVNVTDGRNALYGDYSSFSKTLNESTKYVFGLGNKSDSLTGQENGAVEELELPEIPGYTCVGVKDGSTFVASVATSGFTNCSGTTLQPRNPFQFYITEPPTNGQWQTKNGSCTVELVYNREILPVTNVAVVNSTVVNLFDYWLTTQDAPDNSFNANYANKGINENHELKFVKDGYNVFPNQTMNHSTAKHGIGSNVLQGIVQKELGPDGYPVLSGNTDVGMTASCHESLDYLFNSKTPNDYRESYHNVLGLFQKDDKGYTYYNNQQNFAEFDKDANHFTLYEESAVGAGMFFPFNTIEEAYPLADGNSQVLNHYFGLTLTTRFIQSHDGYSDSNKTLPTTFEFSGDDDVWIFIDNVLVADLGGIHARSSVKINFADGTVTIDTVDGQTKTTYFTDIFKDKDVELEEDTLKDGTVHTMKFFYLERGNSASNLHLKYNLTDIPETSIYKVNQYGESISGAGFAVYPAIEVQGEDGEYQYKDANGNGVTIPENADITIQDDGTIIFGDATIPAAYCGTTDIEGSMKFVDADGMLLSAGELKSMFGEYFFLREIKVPDGYRTLSDDTLLRFKDDLLISIDPYISGVWAVPNALVTATNELIPVEADMVGKTFTAPNGKIQYYNPDSGEKHGTLFAVVLKRGNATGEDNGDRVYTEQELSDSISKWYPIYGNSRTGYNVLPIDDGNQLASVLKAAKLEAELNGKEGFVFSPSASGMQVTLKNMPSTADRYYSYMLEQQKNNNSAYPITQTDPQYLVAYYWTSADNLEDATEQNTVRVHSHGKMSNANANYEQFDVRWGATIEVPNIVNTLYFQKTNTDVDTLIYNAIFALYDVETDKDGFGYYVGYRGTDMNGEKVYIRLDNDAGEIGKAAVYSSIDGDAAPVYADAYTVSPCTLLPEALVGDDNAGNITVTAETAEGGKEVYTIFPAIDGLNRHMVSYTHDECNVMNERGTGHFRYIKPGKYFLKEIEAPAGYQLNYENIMVAVTKTGVYAGAGDTDNHVRVGNGPGHLVSTLDAFASMGHIDETLTWVYGMLKINPDNNNNFNGVAGLQTSRIYGVNDRHYPLLENNITGGTQPNGLTDLGSNDHNYTFDGMISYLVYVGKTDDYDVIFDYNVNTERPNLENTDSGDSAKGATGTRRLWTESGWSDMRIYQDYSYGQFQSTVNIGDAESYLTPHYANLTGRPLEHLFSSSTYVQVSDEADLDLTVVKGSNSFQPVGDDYSPLYLDDAQFYLYRENGGVKEYYSYDSDHKLTHWGAVPELLTTATTFIKDGENTPKSVTVTNYVNERSKSTTVYTIDNANYILTNIDENGQATLSPVEVSDKARISPIENGETLHGKLSRSYFTLHGLAQGTYYLEEVTSPTYTYTGSDKLATKPFEKLGDPITLTITPYADGFNLMVNGKRSPLNLAPYTDEQSNAYQLGFRVWNEATIQKVSVKLIKLDATSKTTDVTGDDSLAGLHGNRFTVIENNVPTSYQLLPDACFRLYYMSGEEKRYYYQDEDGSDRYTGNAEKAKVFRTENAALTLSNLSAERTYYLEETAAPNGYQLLTQPIIFRWISANEAWQIEGQLRYADIQLVPTNAGNADETYIVVYNTTQYRLPETGGSGILPYTFSGIILILIAAAVYGCTVRRKRERRFG